MKDGAYIFIEDNDSKNKSRPHHHAHMLSDNLTSVQIRVALDATDAPAGLNMELFHLASDPMMEDTRLRVSGVRRIEVVRSSYD